MSDEEYIAHLRRELRQNPKDQRLRTYLRYAIRRRDARTAKPAPPERMEDFARAKLITKAIIRNPGLLPTPALPIDNNVRELLSDGLINLAEQESAYMGARLSVVDGCMWGDWYARYKLRYLPNAATTAKNLRDDASVLLEKLEAFTQLHSGHIDPYGLGVLHGAIDLVGQVLERAKGAAVSHPGSPGSPWRVGFVYGISRGWVELTDRKISASSDRFISFVKSGAESLGSEAKAKTESGWIGPIETAIATFGLLDSKRAWASRPGDPLPRANTPQN